MTPSFAVVLPVYDSHLPHLVTALTSVCAQRWPVWTLHVVDDGSTDQRVGAVVRSFARSDHRVRFVSHQTNAGIAAATNAAIEHAISTADPRWIAFVDHDDELHTDALWSIAEHVRRHPDRDLVYTDEQLIDDDGSVRSVYRKPDYSPERLLGQNYLNHVVAVRRDLLDAVGGLDPAYTPVPDRDWVLRATERARSVGHVPEVCYSWRATGTSIAVEPARKGGVGDAVAAAARAALARRGERARVEMVTTSPTCVQVARHAPPDVELTYVRIRSHTASRDVNELLRGRSHGLAVLRPDDAVPVEGPDWVDPLVAQCSRTSVGAAGPRLITDDGRLVSAGRVHHPALQDLASGDPADDPGPWGAYLVAREVASLAPDGLVVRLDQFHALGGLAEDICLEAAVAELCTRLRVHAGLGVIWSPLATLRLPATRLDDDRPSLDHDFEVLARRLPAVLDEPYSPYGVFRCDAEP